MASGMQGDVKMNGSNGPSKNFMVKRENYLEWNDYFMAIAFLSAQRSKDPRTQVGACIVNEDRKIVGIGYNGMPNGCHDDLMPWCRMHETNSILNSKKLYVCHAELNAVLNKNSFDVKNCVIFVALFPCNECAKVLIQSGIKEVVYYSDKYSEKPAFKASRKMFDMVGVKCWQYQPKRKRIVIDFESMDPTNGQMPDISDLSLSPGSSIGSPPHKPDSTTVENKNMHS